jgi:hypothetical protein
MLPQAVGTHPVIGIHSGDELALCCLQTEVQSCNQPIVFQIIYRQYLQASVSRRQY